jgi:hypothetical protein
LLSTTVTVSRLRELCMRNLSLIKMLEKDKLDFSRL